MTDAISRLAELADCARSRESLDDATRAAIATARDLLGAADVCLVDGTRGAYARYSGGVCGDALTDRAIWHVQRELIAADRPRAFRSDAGRVHGFGDPAAATRADYVAALLPTSRYPAHMLIARGPWRRGPGARRAASFSATLPAFARLAERRTAIDEAEADRELLSSLREVSMADGIDALLQRGARMIATLAGVDYVTLVILDDAHNARHYAANVDGVRGRELPVVDERTAEGVHRAVIDQGEALVFRDIQCDKRVPEDARVFFTTMQVRSFAILPVAAGDRRIGMMMISSSRQRDFAQADVQLLDGLSRYVGSAVHAMLIGDELSRSERRLQVIAAHAPIVLFAIDRDGVFTLSEGRGLERLGLGPGEAVGQSVYDLYAGEPEVVAQVSRALAGESFTSTVRSGDLVFDTHYAPVHDAGGGVTGIVGVATDVTERTRALALLADQARRDPLTGVLNHAAITRLAEERIKARQHFAVAMLDVDGMKAVNDTYGHLSGDAVLKAVAGALDDGHAIVGRYGGDEFLVVLPDADGKAARAFAARVTEAIYETKLIDQETSATIRPPVSIGVALFPGEAGSLVDLIKVADGAMYAEKSRRARQQGDLARRLDDRVAGMIGDLVPLLTSPGDLDQKLKLVAARLSSGNGYDAVDCQVFDDQSLSEGTLQDGGIDDLTESWRREQHAVERAAAAERPISVILAKTRRPIVLEDLSSDERLTDGERQLLAAADLQSAIVAPMLWDNELIGTLAVARRQRAAFDPRDAQFLAAVANQVTAIVRMASLVDGLQRATDRLSESQAETVMMLAAAAEAHDHATGLHLQSIRAISEALAAELGYEPAAVRELGLAATLHDIGKISVPDSILSSPLRFDGDDWEIARMWEVLKQHSVWGAEFLASRPGFELAARVARWHHERWDGAGYPDGLRGDQIPEEVTIVTVADAFDAMVQDRPYRAGRPVADAIEEVQGCRGQQFNPVVVDALVRLYRRGALARPDESQLAA